MHAAAAATEVRLAARRAAALAELRRAPLGMSLRSRRLMAASAPGFGQRLQVRRVFCAQDARRLCTSDTPAPRAVAPPAGACAAAEGIWPALISWPVACRAGTHAGALFHSWRLPRGASYSHAPCICLSLPQGEHCPPQCLLTGPADGRAMWRGVRRRPRRPPAASRRARRRRPRQRARAARASRRWRGGCAAAWPTWPPGARHPRRVLPHGASRQHPLRPATCRAASGRGRAFTRAQPTQQVT